MHEIHMSHKRKEPQAVFLDNFFSLHIFIYLFIFFLFSLTANKRRPSINTRRAL